MITARDTMFADEPDSLGELRDDERQVIATLAGLIGDISAGEIDVRRMEQSRDVDWGRRHPRVAEPKIGPTTLEIVYE